jgi:hypothetical protein
LIVEKVAQLIFGKVLTASYVSHSVQKQPGDRKECRTSAQGIESRRETECLVIQSICVLKSNTKQTFWWRVSEFADVVKKVLELIFVVAWGRKNV